MTAPPKGMKLTTFLDKNYDFGQNPHLYCVLQVNQKEKFPAYRCGAAGLTQYQFADTPYRTSEVSKKGLNGRMNMYQNYWLPSQGRIFCALQISAQLVASSEQRTGTDQEGNLYNINQGNLTRVRMQEKIYHHFLDQVGLRWQKEKRNELFQPKSRKGVMEIIEQLRKVQGLRLILFDENDYRVDEKYAGGIDPPKVLSTVDTTVRRVAERSKSDPTLIVRMSPIGIQQLRAGNPTQFDRLINLINASIAARTDIGTSSITIKLDKKSIEDLKGDSPQKFAELTRILKIVANLQDAKQIHSTDPPSDPPIEVIKLPKEAVQSLRGLNGERRRRDALDLLEEMTQPAINITTPQRPQTPTTTRVTRSQARQQQQAPTAQRPRTRSQT